MRVAALYDIHGNLPALESVLEEVRRADVDLIVVGGDVLPGPMPRDTLECLLNVDVPTRFIQGNGDRTVREQMAGREADALPEQARDAIRHSARALLPDDARRLAMWPETLRVPIAGLGDVLFCHATPRNDTDIFFRLTPDNRLAPIFDAAKAPMVICGHTHMQFDRTIGATRVVNAGSVGMPFGEPGAYWLLLGPDVQLRCTKYDLAAAAERIRATDYPHADDFATRNVLHPPSEQEILTAFAKAELK